MNENENMARFLARVTEVIADVDTGRKTATSGAADLLEAYEMAIKEHSERVNTLSAIFVTALSEIEKLNREGV